MSSANSPRHLKITTHYSRARILHLCGLWLKQADFQIGEFVQIEVRKDQLIIKPKT